MMIALAGGICFDGIAMNELQKKLVDLGLSEEMSQQAIDTVLGYIKTKVPDNLEPLLDAAAKGEMPEGDDLLGAVKNLFG